jgi:hypothetical protein
MIQARPLALGGQTLGDGLQVGHELGVISDVLANLINEEVEAEGTGLLIEPGFDLVAKVLDGDRVLGAVFVQDALCVSRVFACHFGVRFCNAACF